MDRLTAMQVFADVAASGSFTASAERLGMSRAMVTRYVAEMEQWLGARLLQRTTRRVTLTDAGEQALRRCLQMLALAEETEDEVAPPDGTLRGQLRLTSSMSFGHAHLAAAISDFLALHPQLKIDLNVGDAALAGGGIALQPTYLAAPLLASGQLHPVLAEWAVPQMTIYALYASRRHLSPAVRALLDFLLARFAGAPWDQAP